MTSKAFAELSATGDRIEVYFRYDEDLHAAIKEIPGARYVPPGDGGPMWRVPLDFETAKRMREEFGDRLIYGEAITQWGREAKKYAQNLKHLASIDSVEIEEMELKTKLPALAEWLRGYQRADTMFLAHTSALNLNEQRLGKTPETIAAIFEAGLENGPHLVAAPRTSLETVWRFEIERWTRDLEKPHEVITFSGALSLAERQRAIDEFWKCVDDDWPVWFVCTYNTLTTGKEPFMDPKEFPNGWNSFSIDEFHKSGLTNTSGKVGTGTKFGDAVKEINAQRRYALSGTPMGGKVIKLWGGLHFLYPERFTSKWQWAKMWLDVSSNGYGQEIGNIKRGRENEFYAAIAPMTVRRLRSEVMPQLPAAQWIDVDCPMTPKQEKQYREFAAKAEATIEDQQLNALGILAEYTRLKVFADAYCDRIDTKQVKCPRCKGIDVVDCLKCMGSGEVTELHPIPSFDSGKLPPLIERLAEQGIVGSLARGDSDSGEGLAIIASQFKLVANMISDYLTEKGIKNVKITGDTPDEQRTEYQMMFRQDGSRRDDDPRVIVMTTTTGGVAITLDLVENVHIMDETWVPDDQQQLADRAVNTSRMHQIGVYVYRSIGTVEQYIQDVNVEKADINRQILDLRRQGFRANQKMVTA
jgi:SNF2 family DNA or RNA helicase